MERNIFYDVLAFVSKKHNGQVDKAGLPCILHPIEVARRVGPSPSLVQLALLHDVLEDTDATMTEIRKLGADDRVVAALPFITRRAGETYRDFIKRCATNTDATLVKIADLDHNLSRIHNIKNASERSSMKYKYLKAKSYLKDVLNNMADYSKY